MDPHPLANLFKRSNYNEPIASQFFALDYLYEVLLEIRESKKNPWNGSLLHVCACISVVPYSRWV